MKEKYGFLSKITTKKFLIRDETFINESKKSAYKFKIKKIDIYFKI